MVVLTGVASSINDVNSPPRMGGCCNSWRKDEISLHTPEAEGTSGHPRSRGTPRAYGDFLRSLGSPGGFFPI